MWAQIARGCYLWALIFYLFFHWFVIENIYKTVNKKLFPQQVRIWVPLLCTAIVAYRVIADTKTFIRLGFEEFRDNYAGGYALLQIAFIISAVGIIIISIIIIVLIV